MTPDDIKKAVKDALHEHKKEFWVEPESHYLQHKFLESMMTTGKTVRKFAIGAFVTLGCGWIFKSLFFKG